MLGTNDAKRFNWYGIGKNKKNTYALDFKHMLNRLMELSSAPHILVLIPPPVSASNRFHIDQQVINTIIPNTLRQIVDDMESFPTVDIVTSGARVDIVDVHQLFTARMSHWSVDQHASLAHDGSNPTPIFSSLVCPGDGVHLTPEGNKVISDALVEAIGRLSADRLKSK
jgi:lysophospholipase L1-like esterase